MTKKTPYTIDLIEIHSFACDGEEVILGATDDNNNDIVITLPTFDAIKIIDKDYMKEQLNKYIKGL